MPSPPLFQAVRGKDEILQDIDKKNRWAPYDYMYAKFDLMVRGAATGQRLGWAWMRAMWYCSILTRYVCPTPCPQHELIDPGQEDEVEPNTVPGAQKRTLYRRDRATNSSASSRHCALTRCCKSPCLIVCAVMCGPQSSARSTL